MKNKIKIRIRAFVHFLVLVLYAVYCLISGQNIKFLLFCMQIIIFFALHIHVGHKAGVVAVNDSCFFFLSSGMSYIAGMFLMNMEEEVHYLLLTE